MKTILDVANLKDKKILLRVDLDIPVSDEGQIEEPFRIKRQKETLDYLIGHGAKVVMAAHISAVPSFANLIPQLHTFLDYEINFLKTLPEISSYLEHYAGPALLDNIRQNDGEEKNDKEFAKQLAQGFDVYVNNASVSAITDLLSSYAGFLIEEEIASFKKAIDAPMAGKIVIIGGAKAETKVPVIKNLINRADFILTGGVVANDILKEKGQDMGSSVVDENSKELLAGLDINDPKLLVPEDFVVFDNKILDIGEETIRKYADAVSRASVVIWNGPMGLFENPTFATGTQKIAEAIAESSAYKIIVGGDTIVAISKFRNIDISKFNFVSTGGGAMLIFLAGQRLPGLEALGYYQN